MNRLRLSSCILSIAALALGPAAVAQTLFTFSLSASTNTRSITVFAGTEAGSESTNAGAFIANFSATGGISNLAVFCIEWEEFITTSNTTHTFANLPLANAARGSAPGNIGAPATLNGGAGLPAGGGAAGGIGATRAQLVRYLYAREYQSPFANHSSWTPDRSAAFQIAIWELTHDSDLSILATGTGTSPVRTGSYQAWPATATQTVAQVNALAHVILAQQWITQAAQDLANNVSITTLPYAVNSDLSVMAHDGYVTSGLAPALVVQGGITVGRQDLIVPTAGLTGTAVPEPSTIALLAGLAVFAAGVVARRGKRGR